LGVRVTDHLRTYFREDTSPGILLYEETLRADAPADRGTRAQLADEMRRAFRMMREIIPSEAFSALRFAVRCSSWMVLSSSRMSRLCCMRAFGPPSAIWEATSSLSRKFRLLRRGSGGRIDRAGAVLAGLSESIPKSNWGALVSLSSISCRLTPTAGRSVRPPTPPPGSVEGPSSAPWRGSPTPGPPVPEV
jgi:hypothetical protein